MEDAEAKRQRRKRRKAQVRQHLHAAHAFNETAEQLPGELNRPERERLLALAESEAQKAEKLLGKD